MKSTWVRASAFLPLSATWTARAFARHNYKNNVSSCALQHARRCYALGPSFIVLGKAYGEKTTRTGNGDCNDNNNNDNKHLRKSSLEPKADENSSSSSGATIVRIDPQEFALGGGVFLENVSAAASPHGQEENSANCKERNKSDSEIDNVYNTLKDSEMLDPDVVHYPLHKMTHITEEMILSLKAHGRLLDFLSRSDKNRLRELCSTMEVAFRSEVPGKALYFRIVNGGQHTQAVHDALVAVVRDYAVRTIAPFPGELCCDVSHYATYAPLVAVSRRNVRQAKLDLECLLAGKPFDAKGVPVTVPAKELAPLTPEKVAREVASRMSEEVRRIVSASSSSCDAGNNNTTVGDVPAAASATSPVRVCIGVATTPVLAKIACDAEAAFIRRHPEKDTVSVRVRSFYGHVRSLKDSKRFMAHFRVSNVPVFTPAFVKVLKDVFNVVTCEDLHTRCEWLSFSLSLETFQVCYRVMCGHMRFECEKHARLLCPAHLNIEKSPIYSLATNAISVVTADRKALSGNPLASRMTRGSRRFPNIDGRLVYGRLLTDEQFVERVQTTFQAIIAKLQLKGFVAGAARASLRRGETSMGFTRTFEFTPTNDYDELMKIARFIGLEILPFRQGTGIEKTGDNFNIHIVMCYLDYARMNPARLEEEIEKVTHEFEVARGLLRAYSIRYHRASARDRNRKKASLEKAKKQELKDAPAPAQEEQSEDIII